MKKNKKKTTEDWSSTTILARVPPELRAKIEKVAALKSWSLSHTMCVAAQQYVERVGS